MFYMRVHASVRQESHDMQCRIIFSAVVCTFLKCRKLKKISILYRLCYTCKLLINYTTGTHVKMSDLGVSHLPLRKSYGKPRCFALNKRAFFHQPVQHRRSGGCHRISGNFFS